MKIKSKRNLIIIGLVLLIGIGTTLAFFANSTTLENLFSSANYRTVVQENFVSPQNWLPGDTTSKTLTVKNEGDGEVYTRICIEDEWVAVDGTILPNYSDDLGEDIAIINLDNQSDWLYAHDDVNDRDCYIYKTALAGNSTSSSFMSGVTYNPNYSGGIVCTTDPITQDNNCTSSTSSYDGAEYILNLVIETIQKKGINESGWGFGYSNNGQSYGFENPDDALDGSRYNTFFRKAATDDGIVEQIGILHDDNYYYITGGDGGDSYEDNKDVLDEIFTSSNCSETVDGTHKTYSCSNNDLEAEIDNEGNVSVIDNEHVFTINSDGNTSIEQYVEPPVVVNAENVSYDNTLTGVSCSDAQCMIDYINDMLE